MRSRILCCLLALALAGCSSPPPTPPETFNLNGLKVQFSPPPAGWRRNQIYLEKPTLGAPDGVCPAVYFTPPSGPGEMGVANLSGIDLEAQVWQDPLQALNQMVPAGVLGPVGKELTTENMERIVLWVVKRQGRVLSQKEVQLGGSPAYQIEFELGQGPAAERGVQIHALGPGRYAALFLRVPESIYKESRALFDNMVRSFTFL